MAQFSPKTISLLCMVIWMAFTSLDLNTHLHITQFKLRTSPPQSSHVQLQMAQPIHADKN